MAQQIGGARVKLSSGFSMPQLGLGTWLSKPGEVAAAVKCAIGAGYRHIDCAQAYGNQSEIGGALKEAFDCGQVKREEMFITSKIWNTFHSHKAAKSAIDSIISELHIGYIDLCLIHWPQGYVEGGEMFPRTADGTKMKHSDVDYLETWKAMEEGVADGKIRSIGVSNFNTTQMQRIIDSAKVQPAVLQVELHPYFPQNALVKWCKDKSIIVTGYSPLANMTHMFRKEDQPNVLEEQVVIEIGRKYGKSAAQVALRWQIERGCCPIPKSTSESRIKENLDIFDFALDSDEMNKINALDKGWRILDLQRDLDHPHFPFHEL